jgi:ubiquinone/menaquinone biosynthesis C-methylase UbiE
MKKFSKEYSNSKKELKIISKKSNYKSRVLLSENQCIVCKSSPKSIFLQNILYKDNEYINFPVSNCKTCGFCYQLFRFDKKFHKFYYKSIISKNLRLDNKILKENFKNSFQRGKFIYKKFANLIGKKKLKILDVGSGTGGLLNFFEKKGHDVYGIEPNKKYFDYSKKKIKNSVNDNFENHKYPTNFFDFVLIIGTLEHVNDPLKTLKEVDRISKKNSILVVDTKGYPVDILKNYFNFNHHRCFTKKTLTYLMNNFKWKKIDLDYDLNYTKLKMSPKIYMKDKKVLKIKKGNILGVFKKQNEIIRNNYMKDNFFQKFKK